MNRYLAIDFETANSNPLSACAIGYTLIEDGNVLVSNSYLVKPPRGYDKFNYYNIKIHNITENMVYNEPTFDVIYSMIKNYFKDCIIIAHNASFDMRILQALKEAYNLDMPIINYFCTVELTRAIFPQLGDHKLNTISKYLNISLNHHEACSDSFACAMIVKSVQNIIKTNSIEELIIHSNVKVKQLV